MKAILLAAALLSLTAAGMPGPQPMPPAPDVFASHQRVPPKACPRRVLVTNAEIVDLIVTGRADSETPGRGAA